MSSFGKTLRAFREMTRNPDRYNRSLSQARVGEQMGHIMEGGGFSGAAVSNWERGINKISAEDRKVLITLIKVLYKYEGVKTRDDANQLLESGDYRALNGREIQEIFGNILEEPIDEKSNIEQQLPKSFFSLLVEYFFAISETELQESLAKAEEGPFPVWPRKLAVLMRKISDRISFSPKTVFWIGLWWLAWWLIAPSMRWPFTDRATALQAIGMYVIGTLVVPLLIGTLIDTRSNEYWQAQGLADSRLLRLYTYQGAGIGFNLGYFFVLPLVLIWHYLNLGPSIWLEIIAATLGLILGNMSAHVVPHNLWLAYSRLRFADGAIFFVVALLGPLWGIFFLEFYSILLEPFWGSLVILIALLLVIMIPIGQSKKKIDPEQAQP